MRDAYPQGPSARYPSTHGLEQRVSAGSRKHPPFPRRGASSRGALRLGYGVCHEASRRCSGAVHRWGYGDARFGGDAVGVRPGLCLPIPIVYENIGKLPRSCM